MSITALQFAIANVTARQSREADDDDLRRLEQLGQNIDAYLNNPRQ